ncbi:uncharacterized protein M6B38_406905 [Iris pallida]|uniref:Uncharacterized protein n=1 Tax=Iris pallida TaxID=29817 RepID=A0AAX6FPV6_IRIPA|nr:uncharacterized protein M6B38_406905 [Iris pallida]
MIRGKSIPSWSDGGSYSFSKVDYLFDIRDIWSLISDNTFLVRDSQGNNYSVYFDIENQIFEIDNDNFFLSELESVFSFFLIVGLRVTIITIIIPCMILNPVGIIIFIVALIVIFVVKSVLIITFFGTDNYSDSYIYSFICIESGI